MIQRVVDTIGLMDPDGYSFRVTFEKLIDFLDLEIRYDGRLHRVVCRRLRSRPYDVLRAVSPYRAVYNRSSRADLHYNSYLLTVAPTTYLLNDMVSFLALDKNATYGHMTRLGFVIPPTAAIPPRLARKPEASSDQIFPESEYFDLAEIGDEIGYPAFLKPQVGDQWGENYPVSNYQELSEAFARTENRPMNLQKAIDYREFVHTMGVGPQMLPMHINPEAQTIYERFLRSDSQAVEHGFLTADQHQEVCSITKVCNAFFNWDHNSCEALLDHDGLLHSIDFANVGPRCSLLELQYYFADTVKAMVKWLIFNSVTGRSKPALGHDWPEYFALLEEALTDSWTYEEKLNGFCELADKHFDSKKFNSFCEELLSDFDEKAYAFFASQTFQLIIEETVNRAFTEQSERLSRMNHYLGVHRFWLHCERDRLGL